MGKRDGHRLSGKTSDRIRSGEITEASTRKVDRAEDKPNTDSVRHGSGHGLGQGASRARGGDETGRGR